MEISIISRFWWTEKNKSETLLFIFLTTAIFCHCKDVQKKKAVVVTLTFSRIFLRTQKFVPQKSTLLIHCFFYLDTRGPKLGAKKSLFWKQGCEFRTLAFNAAEIKTAKMITVLFHLFCFLVLVFDSAKRSYKI